MRLSVVATLYRSEPYVREFVARAGAAAAAITDDYEVVLVNDGSPDGSLAIARELADADAHVVVVDLARNFGHHRAMMAGLAEARGDRVFLIDSDLEEAPELLDRFWQKLEGTPDVDVVYGQLAKRKGGWFERWSGEAFYATIAWLGTVEIPRNLTTARLMTRRYVASLLEYRERELFLAGVWHSLGYRQEPLTMEKAHKGDSSYGLRRKLSLLVNSVTSFSNKPLRLIFYTGLMISLASGIYTATLVFQRLFLSRPPDGWTSLIASVWLLGGLVILFLGVIGIYLSKVFIEVKQRPYVTIRAVHRREPGS